MRINCRDCGMPLPEKLHRSTRQDVCDPCWDNRLWLVGPSVPKDGDFREIQKAMANGRGTASRKISDLKRRLNAAGVAI